jgi:hypothetical protein
MPRLGRRFFEVQPGLPERGDDRRAPIALDWATIENTEIYGDDCGIESELSDAQSDLSQRPGTGQPDDDDADDSNTLSPARSNQKKFKSNHSSFRGSVRPGTAP